MVFPHDVARTRLDNALLLFDEFVRATIKQPDAATLRGLERRFAERLQIQPSYWSQIKGRSRQIGERLARQFEQLCHKPHGWMDEPHGSLAATGASGSTPDPQSAREAASEPSTANDSQPQDADERFIVALVLSYYRRHPQRARQALLGLLGEVLTPEAEPAALPTPTRPARHEPAPRPAPKPAPAPPADAALWQQVQVSVAPLRRRR